MFMTKETALDVARLSVYQAVEPLVIPEDSISAVMVKVAPGADRRQVAADIAERVPGVTVIESPNLFQSYRAQIDGLLKTVLAILGIVWVLAVAAIGIVFSMAVSERRREIGVLRALGATQSYVMRSLLTEAGLLAVSGAALGVAIALAVTYLFGDYIRKSLGIRFIMPAPSYLLSFLGAGLLVAAASVVVAAFIPALRICQLEPALAMRE
jgi:putative ABC transport system permease protein